MSLQLSDNLLANDIADLADWRWPASLLELYLGNNRLQGSLPAAFVAPLPRGLQVGPYARLLQPGAITCRCLTVERNSIVRVWQTFRASGDLPCGL